MAGIEPAAISTRPDLRTAVTTAGQPGNGRTVPTLAPEVVGPRTTVIVATVADCSGVVVTTVAARSGIVVVPRTGVVFVAVSSRGRVFTTD